MFEELPFLVCAGWRELWVWLQMRGNAGKKLLSRFLRTNSWRRLHFLLPKRIRRRFWRCLRGQPTHLYCQPGCCFWSEQRVATNSDHVLNLIWAGNWKQTCLFVHRWKLWKNLQRRKSIHVSFKFQTTWNLTIRIVHLILLKLRRKWQRMFVRGVFLPAFFNFCQFFVMIRKILMHWDQLRAEKLYSNNSF